MVAFGFFIVKSITAEGKTSVFLFPGDNERRRNDNRDEARSNKKGEERGFR